MPKSQDIALDEQAWENDYLKTIKLENGSEVVLPTNPIQFTSMGPAELKLGLQLGADSVEILKSLGCSASQITDLIEKQAVVAK